MDTAWIVFCITVMVLVLWLGMANTGVARRRRPEQPDPRQRKAWTATKSAPRFWWRIW